LNNVFCEYIEPDKLKTVKKRHNTNSFMILSLLLLAL
jgi:hypothetical protein